MPEVNEENNKLISELDPNLSLTGTEEKAVERGGSNYKQTLNQEKDFHQANLTFVEGVTGDGVDNTDPENPVLAFPDTSEVAETVDKNYVSDAQKVVIENTSGANTGDETTGTIQSKRPIKTVNGSTLEGAGDLLLINILNDRIADFTIGTDSNDNSYTYYNNVTIGVCTIAEDSLPVGGEVKVIRMGTVGFDVIAGTANVKFFITDGLVITGLGEVGIERMTDGAVYGGSAGDKNYRLY